MPYRGYKHSHPYAHFEDSHHWQQMTQALKEMKQDEYIEVTTDETYVVGHLCEVLQESKPKTIYVSGPYTKGDPCENTHNAIVAANKLMDAGFIPFVPHLSHFWHTMSPRPYADWMKIDMAFLPTCKAFLRLPGESKGADLEEAEAKRQAMNIYYSIEELIANEK